eukprot:19382-Heterococcus_DN1.PRE.2
MHARVAKRYMIPTHQVKLKNATASASCITKAAGKSAACNPCSSKRRCSLARAPIRAQQSNSKRPSDRCPLVMRTSSKKPLFLPHVSGHSCFKTHQSHRAHQKL